MDSLKHLLADRDNTLPPEVQIIKDYVQAKFKSDVSVTVQEKQIIISASNAALAGTLRLYSHQLAQACQTDKKLIFKIA